MCGMACKGATRPADAKGSSLIVMVPRCVPALCFLSVHVLGRCQVSNHILQTRMLPALVCRKERKESTPNSTSFPDVHLQLLSQDAEQRDQSPITWASRLRPEADDEARARARSSSPARAHSHGRMRPRPPRRSQFGAAAQQPGMLALLGSGRLQVGGEDQSDTDPNSSSSQGVGVSTLGSGTTAASPAAITDLLAPLPMYDVRPGAEAGSQRQLRQSMVPGQKFVRSGMSFSAAAAAAVAAVDAERRAAAPEPKQFAQSASLPAQRAPVQLEISTGSAIRPVSGQHVQWVLPGEGVAAVRVCPATVSPSAAAVFGAAAPELPPLPCAPSNDVQAPVSPGRGSSHRTSAGSNRTSGGGGGVHSNRSSRSSASKNKGGPKPADKGSVIGSERTSRVSWGEGVGGDGGEDGAGDVGGEDGAGTSFDPQMRAHAHVYARAHSISYDNALKVVLSRSASGRRPSSLAASRAASRANSWKDRGQTRSSQGSDGAGAGFMACDDVNIDGDEEEEGPGVRGASDGAVLGSGGGRRLEPQGGSSGRSHSDDGSASGSEHRARQDANRLVRRSSTHRRNRSLLGEGREGGSGCSSRGGSDSGVGGAGGGECGVGVAGRRPVVGAPTRFSLASSLSARFAAAGLIPQPGKTSTGWGGSAGGLAAGSAAGTADSKGKAAAAGAPNMRMSKSSQALGGLPGVVQGGQPQGQGQPLRAGELAVLSLGDMSGSAVGPPIDTARTLAAAAAKLQTQTMEHAGTGGSAGRPSGPMSHLYDGTSPLPFPSMALSPRHATAFEEHLAAKGHPVASPPPLQHQAAGVAMQVACDGGMWMGGGGCGSQPPAHHAARQPTAGYRASAPQAGSCSMQAQQQQPLPHPPVVPPLYLPPHATAHHPSSAPCGRANSPHRTQLHSPRSLPCDKAGGVRAAEGSETDRSSGSGGGMLHRAPGMLPSPRPLHSPGAQSPRGSGGFAPGHVLHSPAAGAVSPRSSRTHMNLNLNLNLGGGWHHPSCIQSTSCWAGHRPNHAPRRCCAAGRLPAGALRKWQHCTRLCTCTSWQHAAPSRALPQGRSQDQCHSRGIRPSGPPA